MRSEHRKGRKGREGGSEKLVTSSRPPNCYSLSPQNSDLFRANFPRIVASLMEARLTLHEQFQLDFRRSLIYISSNGVEEEKNTDRGKFVRRFLLLKEEEKN